MKEFLLLIREDVSAYGNMTAEEMQADIERHMAWARQLTDKGFFKSGNPLAPEGKTLKNKTAIVTDGAYIETKEVLSGYYFLYANSLEHAAEIAQGCPSLLSGGAIEIREVINTEE